MEPALAKQSDDAKLEADEKTVETTNNHDSEQKARKPTVAQRRQKRLEQEEWLRECRLLQTRYDTIERQLSSIFTDRHSLWNQVKDMLDWKELMRSQRDEKISLLTDDILQTTQFVSQFQLCLENIQNNTAFVKKVASLADKIEEKILKIKRHNLNVTHELSKSESILMKEIMCHNDRFESWSQQSKTSVNQDQSQNKTFKSNIAPPAGIDKNSQKSCTNESISQTPNRYSSFAQTQDSRPSELVEIQKMLDEYGPSGGWPDQDHSDFLKLSAQLRNDHKKLLSHLSEVLPQYSLTELRRHMEWHTTYQRLWKRKKEILKKWKVESEDRKRKQDELKQLRHTEKMNKEKKMKRKLQQQRQETKSAIKQWKNEKEQKEMMDKQSKLQQEKKLKRMKQKQANERIKRHRRLLTEMEAKNKMNEYSETCQKINKKPFSSRMEAMQQHEQKEILRMKFQIKDSQILESRMLLKERKSLEEKHRQQKLDELIQVSKPTLNVKKDRFRLTSMTSAVAQRYHETQLVEKEPALDTFAPVGYSFDSVASRATPAWRKDL